MFISFVSQRGQNIMVNIKDISLIVQKGVYCEIYVRGIVGHVTVQEDFPVLSQKIKDISSFKNNSSG